MTHDTDNPCEHDKCPHYRRVEAAVRSLGFAVVDPDATVAAIKRLGEENVEIFRLEGEITKGDAEIARLRRDVADLRAMLAENCPRESIDYGEGMRCSLCHAYEAEAHKPDCAYVALMERTKP